MKRKPAVLIVVAFAAGCASVPRADVLPSEPANLPLNEPLLIDDGSCPTGLIKRLIYQGPRQSLVRECVRRPAL